MLTEKDKDIKKCLEFIGQQVAADSNIAEMRFYDYCDIVRRDGMLLNTLEGQLMARTGDYIIKGVEGEFYPCKPEIFKKTYEEVS